MLLAVLSLVIPHRKYTSQFILVSWNSIYLGEGARMGNDELAGVRILCSQSTKGKQFLLLKCCSHHLLSTAACQYKD